MATKKYDCSASAGRRYNYTFALAGMPGVGKTSIFKYIQRNVEHVNLTSSYSEGLDCCAFPLTVDGVKYQITLYDTGGMERYNSLTANYYQNCQGIILVYSNCTDKVETVTGLSTVVDSAIDYNKTPDLLVFALWGSVLDEEQEMPLMEMAKSYAENCQNGPIPESLTCTVCPNTGMGIMNGLNALVLAAAEMYKPRADSVLDVANETSSEDDSVIGPREMEELQEEQKSTEKRKCWC